MASEDLFKKYMRLGTEERLELICEHYGSFLGIVDSYTEGIIYMIEEEQDYNHRQEMGDLGVRVQTSGMHSDRTAKQAIRNVDLRDAVENCRNLDEALDDTDHKEIFIDRCFTLKKMRKEYRLLSKQIASLDDMEKELFEDYLTRAKSVQEVAAQLQIEYDSAQQWMRRIKTKVKAKAMQFADGSFLLEV